MELIHTVAELRKRLAAENSTGFVPTMGNLHAGHIHLADIARLRSNCLVASIFVNPLQFGANEDLENYPRTLEEDCSKLEAAGVDIVFAPSANEMYPVEQTVMVEPPPIADELCGASRPGHFKGVATVVLKLFNMVHPQIAVFGKKDFQQLFIIRQLVRQLNLPIEIISGETVREPDGLAMSSRNGYLSPEERSEASRLCQALRQVVQTVQSGHKDFCTVEAQAKEYLARFGWQVDYVSIRTSSTLQPATEIDRDLIVLGAARLGNTRLIDNIEFDKS